ncbi:MAG: DegT/DnrJ/EryC1/StrS aminotransferase family protein, partial [Acidobacteriaceae bacterium]|nr:DegT/DnrJ/EryC1/StrS aminotransferase family protein [Acidobacteriaceae bacterium]
DAAHAFPARYKERMIGSIGDVTCFSFYATKTITTGGEGGVAATADREIADRMRIMRLHGINIDAWKRYAPSGSWRYQILDAGYKYNLTDLAAAIGIAQLHKCNRMWARRREIAHRYARTLAHQEAYVLPGSSQNVEHSWHLYVILVNDCALKIGRDRLIEELTARGVGTSVHFIPLHLHAYYQQSWDYRPGDFPVAEYYFDRCLSLPIFPGMSDEDVDQVCEALLEIGREFRR